MDEELKEAFGPRLRELAHKSEVVEERLKEAEQICGQVIYPAVNELRYQGRNLSFIAAGIMNESISNDQFERYLLDAENCCIRANHDITDAIFTYLSLEIDTLRKAYGASLIQAHFDDYTDKIDTIHTIQSLISKSRGKGFRERASIYQDIEHNHLDEIIEFHKELAKNRNLLGEHYRQIEGRARLFQSAAYIGLFASILTILQFFGVNFSDIREYAANISSKDD